MVSFPAIEPGYDQVFGFLERDLTRILTLEQGGNYAAAAMISIGCECLAYYRTGSQQGELEFRQLLPEGPFRDASASIDMALRNGLAHGYGPNLLRIGQREVGLGIAWREATHLSVVAEAGTPVLVLNVRDLAPALAAACSAFRSALERDDELRTAFARRVSTRKATQVGEARALAAWQLILEGV